MEKKENQFFVVIGAFRKKGVMYSSRINSLINVLETFYFLGRYNIPHRTVGVEVVDVCTLEWLYFIFR